MLLTGKHGVKANPFLLSGSLLLKDIAHKILYSAEPKVKGRAHSQINALESIISISSIMRHHSVDEGNGVQWF